MKFFNGQNICKGSNDLQINYSWLKPILGWITWVKIGRVVGTKIRHWFCLGIGEYEGKGREGGEFSRR